MKYLSILIILLFSCSEVDIELLTGCRTAIDKATNERVYLRCEMYQEFNKTNIRASQWDTTDSLYYNYSWVKCDNCE